METSHLSTSSSEKTFCLKGAQAPKAFVASVLLILLIEIALHLSEDKLPEPVIWGSGETSVKVAQVIKRADENKNKALDILIAGPSHASLGISPQAMKSVNGCNDLQIYNGGLNGRTYSVVNFVSKNVYEPLLRPSIIVLTASPVILNGNNQWMERNSSEFFAAPMPKALLSKSPERNWRIFLNEHIFLFKYRRREWKLSEGYLNGKKVVDAFGYHAVEGVYDENSRRELLEGPHPYLGIMNAFTFDGPSVESFVEMITRLQAIGCTVIVVNMPFRDALLEISDTGSEDYQAYLNALHALSSQLGFTWLDYQENMTFTDDDFRDVDHLNTTGAIRLSEGLAQDVLQIAF